ncbi:MAG: low temperature requirement protein A [Dehalococcoidia bacterium]
MSERGSGLLREQGSGAAEVRPIELFFDLVYVLAVTQLTHHLLDHLSPRGAGETLLLLLAVWSVWAHTAWITSRLDAGALSVRLMLVALMLGSLLLSAWLPYAFGDRGLVFATVYVAIQTGRTVFVIVALGHGHALAGHFRRMLLWFSASGLLWLVGGVAHCELRGVIWAVAIMLDYAAVGLGYPLPGLGHSRRIDAMIAGDHLAHRCYLFVILALGESILVIGATLGGLPTSPETLAAFVVAFIGSVALWWIYFDRDEDAGLRAIAAAAEPGRLARSAYSYFHIPIVAGIIVVAAADDFMVAHPLDEATVATTTLVLGGPTLYLAGTALFHWALWHDAPRSRLLAIGALAALVPIAIVSSALLSSSAATLVLIGVSAWDGRRAGKHGHGSTRPDGADVAETIHARVEDASFSERRI